MQKGEQNKLKMLLIGFSARLEQNRDYFVLTEMQFRSGGKSFTAKLSTGEKENWMLRFQGADTGVTARQAADFFASKAGEYEEAVLHYVERGREMTITCTPRGVNMRQSEQQAAPRRLIRCLTVGVNISYGWTRRRPFCAKSVFLRNPARSKMI